MNSATTGEPDEIAAPTGAPDADESMISLRDVHKVYRLRDGSQVHALDGLSLNIPAGSIHGIVGTSGAGKSTLVRCLTALERPTYGEVRVAGQDLTTLSANELRKARRAIGMVFQHANLLDQRTAAQNIAYPLDLAGAQKGQRHERVSRMLELVGLADRGSSYPAQLSGGQKQRVGIARALADEPAVLLCDEPTSALDPETTRSILDLIRDVRDRLGVTVVIITHEMSVVRRICDSVSLLEAGRIVQSGPIEDVVSDVDSRLSLELVPPPDVPKAALVAGSTEDTDDQADGAGGADRAGSTDSAVIDVAMTAHPGEPAAAQVLSLVAEQGADVAGGVFETLGTAQVGRLALTIPADRAQAAVAALREAGITAEVRS
ncbi:methionine ABC transporter ATP-binding protein [Actinomyces massiliensis]|uniref:ABC transporter, ATP-binding protein n=1 Tax=Actinomyces massiliensis F0489 TaxID=1125718 RepID=J0N9Y7_9ACTO|nr:methionine ABC transporter ATP-binding protein [Actinomyces massiliensis]EJF41402.1 ABC transporter, ATP-binding protein [Actinomyces massiliensis F0489]WLD73177.1 methionine ABC transporter ATP-binding protein [Actinomyces massiliensis]